MKPDDAWPPLPPPTWAQTLPSLHMWTQVVGKIALALTPLVNHFWNVALRVTPRGFETYPMPFGERTLAIVFDFVDSRLKMVCSDGSQTSFSLEAMTVADFYRRTMDGLSELGVHVRIRTLPSEVPNPIPFEDDTEHRSYDAAAAEAYWRMLNRIVPVFERFRARFIGKSSPVHFWWGAFDLSVSRYSGKMAPPRPGADSIQREAYSHETISHGFWPGGGPVKEPSFYGYAAPVPEGLDKAAVGPAGASWDATFREFLMPYSAVASAASPDDALIRFMDDTYVAGANLLGWDRAALERPLSNS